MKNYDLKSKFMLAMYQNKLNRIQLSELMELSYPTMLSKLNDPGTMKLSEADKLCKLLNINLKELLTN